MRTAEELIAEYMEHYEVSRLEALMMAIEDIRDLEKELVKLGFAEVIKEKQ